jgi:ABC-2 type transport system permease protein
MSLFTAFRKEWQEALRSYRLLIVIIVLVFFGLTSPLQAKLLPQILTTALPSGTDLSSIIPEPTVWSAIDQYVKNMGQFDLILAVLLGMGAIAQEKDKGTAAMMVVKPLPRGSFLGAKFLGLAAVFAISIAIAAIGSYYYTGLLFEWMGIVPWLVLNVFLFLYVLVIVAITLLCSTIMNSQAAAGGMVVGIIMLGFILGAIRNMGRFLPGELNTWSIRLMHGSDKSSYIALGISLGLILISFLAAWLIFRNQEL